MVEEPPEEAFVVFEAGWVLLKKLVGCVEELVEHWGDLARFSRDVGWGGCECRKFRFPVDGCGVRIGRVVLRRRGRSAVDSIEKAFSLTEPFLKGFTGFAERSGGCGEWADAISAGQRVVVGIRGVVRDEWTVGGFLNEPLFGAEEAAAVAETVAETDPVLLDKSDEAVDRAEIRVEANLCEAAELRCPVPAVGAVDEHMGVFDGDLADDNGSTVEEETDVLEPA